ncbi:hypothetical protein EV682_107144 [Iodobacter fluviatilis]|uniref:Uncharacterized protein n=1 Tax=Iodobacter fluviatilis TaxID=537 RepID=A0A377SUE5_9NEIS|nr:hypothetical protein EV682_107144 [Iodobacter fluviatilis]STR44918.1 Uncharacterised protein [Iodobacter fluviatilis]
MRVTLGSVDVSFTAALAAVLGLNKAKDTTWYEYHERLLTPCSPKNAANPPRARVFPRPAMGLGRKTAIHGVMLLGNNQLLPSSHALCLAVFRLSAIVNEASTDT